MTLTPLAYFRTKGRQYTSTVNNDLILIYEMIFDALIMLTWKSNVAPL